MIPCIIFLASFGGSLADAPKDTIDIERNRLKGTWELHTLEGQGKVFFQPGEVRVVISGHDTITILNKGQGSVEGQIAFNPLATPRAYRRSFGTDETTRVGIYKLFGDTLILCFMESNGKEYPKDFSPEKGKSIVTYKRLK